MRQVREPTTIEHARTLVLDVAFQPSLVVPWERAMTSLVKESARLVASYDSLLVRTVSSHFPCPAVISTLGRASPRKPKGNGFSRKALYRRDGYQCQYCGKGFSPDELTIDHVLPKSRGGRLTWENSVTCCVACNQRKRDRTPSEAGMSVLNVPCAPGYMSFADLHDITTLPTIWAAFLDLKSRRA